MSFFKILKFKRKNEKRGMENFDEKLYSFENSVTYNTRLGYLREGDQVISIDRDYTETIIPQFSLVYPQILEDRISKEDFTRVVNAVNGYLREAEAIKCSSCCECFMGYLTCFLTNIFCTSNYEKSLIRLTKYLNEQNSFFIDYGITWLNPVSNGLLHLDILLTARKSGLLKISEQKIDIGLDPDTSSHGKSNSSSSSDDDEETLLQSQISTGLEMK